MSRSSATRTVAAVALMGLALASCATGQGGGDKNAAPQRFDSGASLKGSITLMGFSGGTDDVGKSRLATATKAIAPVTLTQTPGAFDVQQFLSAVASGAAPDLIYADRDQLGSFAARGVIMPLDDCISGEKIDEASFRKPALSQVTLDGRVYGIPEFNQVEVLMANSQLLQQAGLSLDDVNGSDWGKVQTAAQALVKKDGSKLQVIGYDSKLPEFLPLWAKANGADLLSSDGKKAQLDDPKVVEALTFALGIYKEQGGFGRVKAYRDSADFFGKGNQFATGTLGAMPMEQWYINVLNDVSPGVKMSFDSMRGKDGQPLSFATGSAWAIPTKAKNPQAACRFARSMTATDTWLAAAKVRADARAKDGKPFTGLLTANQKADEAIRSQYVKPSGQKVWDDAVAAMYTANDHTFTFAANPADAEFKAAWQGAVNRALNGQQDPKAALAQGQKEAQAALDTAWDELGEALMAVSTLARPALRPPRRVRQREARTALLFISPWLLGFLIFTAWPMIYSAYLSLTDYDVINAPSFVGLDNYRQMVQDPKVLLALGNTFWFVVVQVPLHVLAALAIAMLLARAGRTSGFFRVVAYLPKMTPPVAAGVLLLMLLNGQGGLVNEVLSWVGIQGPAWTTDPQWVKPGLVLLSLWTVGSSSIILLAALRAVPAELYDSARVDGAGWWHQTRYVTLPMISPALFFITLVSTIAGFQAFTEAYTAYFGSGNTTYSNDAALFYAIYLFQQAFQFLHMGYASALAWLLFVIIAVFSAIQVLVSRRLVHYEAGD